MSKKNVVAKLCDYHFPVMSFLLAMGLGYISINYVYFFALGEYAFFGFGTFIELWLANGVFSYYFYDLLGKGNTYYFPMTIQSICVLIIALTTRRKSRKHFMCLIAVFYIFGSIVSYGYAKMLVEKWLNMTRDERIQEMNDKNIRYGKEL